MKRFNASFYVTQLNKNETILIWIFLDSDRINNYKKFINLIPDSKNIGVIFRSKKIKKEYHNVKKCGIGEHGDEERIKVIALSLGASRPISWRWFHRCKPISERQTFILNKGDMYIMSEKTTGHDWKKQVIRTLRHCAGEKYVK